MAKRGRPRKNAAKKAAKSVVEAPKNAEKRRYTDRKVVPEAIVKCPYCGSISSRSMGFVCVYGQEYRRRKCRKCLGEYLEGPISSKESDDGEKKVGN